MTANGQRYSRRHAFRAAVYWDSYAYEPKQGFNQHVLTPGQLRTYQRDMADELDQSAFVEAKSAFGGLAIYRANLLRGARYSVLPNDNTEIPVLSEHHGLHREIRSERDELRLYINSAQSVDYGSWWYLAKYTLRSFFQR
jgi:hypothetical protein